MVGEPYAYLPQCLAHCRHTLNIVKMNQSVLITQLKFPLGSLGGECCLSCFHVLLLSSRADMY